MYMMNEGLSRYIMASRDGDTRASSDDSDVALAWLKAQEIPACVYELTSRPALSVGTGPMLYHHEVVMHNLESEV